jgi:hypothetical protein
MVAAGNKKRQHGKARKTAVGRKNRQNNDVCERRVHFSSSGPNEGCIDIYNNNNKHRKASKKKEKNDNDDATA